VSGRKGRSGGSNRISIDQHRLRGTYPRHAPARAGALTVTAAARVGDQLPSALIDGLADRGRAFVCDCFSSHSGWNAASMTLLHEAGVVIDSLESLRGTRGERPAQRTLLQLLNALRLE
jgi:hypothetical protein